MKTIRWDPGKSEKLKRERGVSFEEIILAKFIADVEHPRRFYQRVALFELSGYIWAVPYVEKDDEIFWKTLFPSRRYTKMWKRGEFDEL